MLLKVLTETRTLFQNGIQQCSYGKKKSLLDKSLLSGIAGWLSGANFLFPIDWQQFTDHNLIALTYILYCYVIIFLYPFNAKVKTFILIWKDAK